MSACAHRIDEPCERCLEGIDCFARNTIMINEGLCPNGCGPLVQDSESKAHCPRCPFVYQRSKLYVGEP